MADHFSAIRLSTHFTKSYAVSELSWRCRSYFTSLDFSSPALLLHTSSFLPFLFCLLPPLPLFTTCISSSEFSRFHLHPPISFACATPCGGLFNELMLGIQHPQVSILYLPLTLLEEPGFLYFRIHFRLFLEGRDFTYNVCRRSQRSYEPLQSGLWVCKLFLTWVTLK